MSQANLVLETGDVFRGTSIGYSGFSVGEAIFNTSITGYQEILSDPSYAQQLIALTYPHVGNVGTNKVDNESHKVYANGLIVRQLSTHYSNWRAEYSLSDYLKKHKVVGIADIDTRRLIRIIREKGALKACITTNNSTDMALKEVKKYQGLENCELASLVSTSKKYNFNQGSYNLEKNKFNTLKKRFKVAVYDYGVKLNILRLLVDMGCDLEVFPAKTPLDELLKIKPDGIFLSNGPGDPKACDYAILNIQKILKLNIPVFGICLGHQLLALAVGAKTKKMKFGHHGANHPVIDLESNRVLITSQNHGFTISDNDLGQDVVVNYRSLFDNTIQGIRIKNKKAFGFQGHPEASPGPCDARYLFNKFKELML